MKQIHYSKKEIEIIQAGKKFIKKRLGWDVEPVQSIITEDILLFEYDDSGENLARLAINEDKIQVMYAKGKKIKYAWIEFVDYRGLLKPNQS